MPLQYSRSEYLELFAYFSDPDSESYVDPRSPSVSFRIKSTQAAVSPTVMCPLEKVNDSVTGYYHVDILSSGLTATTYEARFQGYYPVASEQLIFTTGEFTLVEVPYQQALVNLVRMKLEDDVTSRYQLDDPTVFKWSNKELYVALQHALSHLNITPPRVVTHGMETAPEDLLITGAFWKALTSRAVLEAGNEFSSSDGELSLTIQRSQKYLDIAEKTRATWLQDVKDYKKDQAFRIVKPIALRSTKLPLTGRFLLSLLPRTKVLFQP